MLYAAAGDYCDVFLTHDSMSGEQIFGSCSHSPLVSPQRISTVRKAHNSGRNHLSNVRDYYACMYMIKYVWLSTFTGLMSHAALGHDKAQNIIDQITQAYESGGGPPPGGFGFTAASLGAPPGFGRSSTSSQISQISFAHHGILFRRLWRRYGMDLLPNPFGIVSKCLV